jgi:hypothetical protein
MLEKVRERFEAWVERWALIVLAPRSYVSQRDNLRISAPEFCIGNTLASLVLTMFIGLLHLLVSLGRPPTTVAKQAGEAVQIILNWKIGAGYIAVNIIFLSMSAMISYIVYRMFRSRAPILPHFRTFLDLTALEPLATAAITFGWLTNFTYPYTAILSLSLFVFTRGWYLLVGWITMRQVHGLRGVRGLCAFVVGFSIAIAILNLGLVLICWLMAMLFEILRGHWL